MSNKKSKYQSIVVNKKRYYFYKITWLDIYGDSGHGDYGEMMQMQPAKMITHAFIFDKDRVIQHASINALDTGRNAQEVLRTLKALQAGGMTGCAWDEGDTLL